MSDIVREISDDIRSGRIKGHVAFEMYSLSPEYVKEFVLPGDKPQQYQRARNASYATTTADIVQELRGMGESYGDNGSISMDLKHYSEDPHFYTYVVGVGHIHLGPFSLTRKIATLSVPRIRGRVQAVIATQNSPTTQRIPPPVSATRVSYGGDR